MKTRRPAPDPRPPVAVSFLRYSDPVRQRRGDSTRRQAAGSEAWCEKSGVPLDRSLRHAGSAFRGRQRDDNAALGGFLKDAQEGKVPRGSYLIIENLDRLSREDERTALRLWLDILDAGVNIVQLHPETVFRHERSEMVDIIRAIIELSRGHSESRMKSVRSLANWARALERARGEGRPVTGRLPSWVELTDDGLSLIPGRALVVKRLFDMARGGYGAASIVKRLNAEGVPAFGSREPDPDGEGGHRAAGGDRYGCGEWRTSYVRNILKDRRALGEFQPRDSAGRAKGDPIPGYYPAVVAAEEFHAARAAVGRRTLKPGRIGEGVANLFGGLLRNARDGSTYYAACRSDAYGLRRELLNQSAVEKKARAYTFPYEVFERCILSRLRELDPAAVVAPVPATEVSVYQDELNHWRQRKAALALELLRGDVAEVADALREVKAREEALLAKIAECEDTKALPPADTWRDMHSLVDLLENAEDREDVRLRLRAALRRAVQEVWLLVVPRGRARLCAVQVYFPEGTHRDYLILYRPGHANKDSRRPAPPPEVKDVRFEAGDPDPGKALNLRDRKDAADLEAVLLGVGLPRAR
jgi:DNA invertase Pin-like site-specific DNA recombinase